MAVHKVIDKAVPYVINGEARDHEWVLNNRPTIESYTYDEMRKDGFIPIIDWETRINFDFNEEKETFNYKLTVMGYKVGRKKSKKYVGIMAGQGIAIGTDSTSVALVDAL